MNIVGIDPGVSGGIAVLYDDGRIETFNMPDSAEGITTLLWKFQELPPKFAIFIEQIPKFCGAARFAERQIMGSSLAVLYGNYQFCCGVLHGVGIPPRLLGPLKWQNLVRCRNHERAGNTAWKNKLKRRAQELFPGVHVTLWNADALLIAYAGRLIDKGA